MGIYEIEIQGVKIKVNVVDHAALVDTYISELRCLVQRHIVGFDLKIQGGQPKLLLLCVGTRCLIIQLDYMGSVPSLLMKFLADETICFVGTGMSDKISMIHRYKPKIQCKTGVELGYLAARVLKKPSLEKYGSFELARLVRVYYVKGTCIVFCPDWSARVFSHEQIEYAIRDVYTSYVIGNKLLSML